MNENAKQCTKCGIEKLRSDEFFKDARLKSGYRACCKRCDVAIKRPSAIRTFEPRTPKQKAEQIKRVFGPRTPEQKAKHATQMRKRLAFRRKNDSAYIEFKKEHDRAYRQSEAGRATKLRAKAKRRQRGGMHTLTASQWAQTLAAFSGVCAYCDCSKSLTADHFVPLVKGGGTITGNIVPACHSCNSSKQHKNAQEWCSPEHFRRIQQILEPLTNL